MPAVSDKLSKQKYDQYKLEEEVKSFWENEDIYSLVKTKSMKSNKKFYFLDGPPYASAKSIHIGTAWNKIIKDVNLRYYRMKGYNVWDQPGYDTHGLPIEVKIEKELGTKSKKDIVEKIGVENFINLCKKFVDENMEAMTKQFKEIGVFMDWKNPYVTYKDDYMESGWWLIKKAHEQGLLYRGLKVHHWCPRCETTLADYEVSEYTVLEDPSIYVKFPVKNKDNEHLLIWTTTPWTLPANAFVMAHPELTYVRVRVGSEILILAKARLEHVMNQANITEYEVIEELQGSELEGLEYTHPLESLVDAQKTLSKYHRIVLAPEAVTAHEGTGLVHSAPGHGDIDFEVNSKTLKAPVISLVDDRGYMTEGAGKYKGLYFRGEANKAIVEDLERLGALLVRSSVKHKYPVCWRCKTPLVLRATEQWFIKVTKLKDKVMHEARKIKWKPEWASKRFMNLIKDLRDWVISRQRFWGIPLPVWECTSCRYTHVIGSVDEIEKMGGKRPPNLHRPWIDQVTLKCPKCGGVMRRVPDVLDVWFDSGVSFYASLGYPKNRELWNNLKPVDLIIEGHDQIRGWFFSLLRSGVISIGEKPYLRVMVHGFALDEQGREMHKSLGNYVEFEELISKVPRDVVRFWVMQTTVWEDLRFSWKGLSQMAKTFNIIWNVYSFASTYMSLDRFDPESTNLESIRDKLRVEDKWILSRLNNLVKKYHEAMNDMRPHDAARLLKEFIVEDVSHWYVRLIRRRVWQEEDTPDKRAAYATLYEVLKKWLILAAPFIPFTTEYVYQYMFRDAEHGAPKSIHLLDMPDADESFIDEKLERYMDIVRKTVELAVAARNAAGLKLRRPVKRLIVSPVSSDIEEALSKLREVLLEAVNAKSLEIVGTDFFASAKIYDVEPNYSTLGPSFKSDMPKVLELINKAKSELIDSILSKGYFESEVNGKRIRIERKHLTIKASYPEWLSVVESDIGIVAIDTRISIEELVEGLAREVVRRIQAMRKELDLNVDAYIEVWIKGDSEILDAVNKMLDYVKNETRAINVNFNEPPEDTYTKEWEVDEKRIIISIKEVTR